MPVIPDNPKGTQAPIFRRRPELLAKFDAEEIARRAAIKSRQAEPDPIPEPAKPALVTPLTIFAAQRGSFEAVVRGPFGAREALAVIFSQLPLEEQGWEFDRTDINLAGQIDGFPVWRVSREHLFVTHAGVTQAEHQTAPSVPKPSKSSDHQITGGGR